jgi:hypothetical protein
MNSIPRVLLKAEVPNGTLAAAKLPRGVKILHWGDNPSTRGNFRVGTDTLACLEENQHRLGFDRIPVDYNHSSEPSSDSYKEMLKAGRPPIIFGYGNPKVIAGQGVWLLAVDWTPAGRESALNFQDISPSLASNRSGEVVFISSVALCTNGSLHHVTLFSAGLAGRVLLGMDQAGAGNQAELERQRLLEAFAAEGRVAMNPTTGQPFSRAELGALSVPHLRLLMANAPRRGGLAAPS